MMRCGLPDRLLILLYPTFTEVPQLMRPINLGHSPPARHDSNQLPPDSIVELLKDEKIQGFKIIEKGRTPIALLHLSVSLAKTYSQCMLMELSDSMTF